MTMIISSISRYSSADHGSHSLVNVNDLFEHRNRGYRNRIYSKYFWGILTMMTECRTKMIITNRLLVLAA